MHVTSVSMDSTKVELAAEAVRSLGELRFRATGSSMLPAILAGDVLWVRRCGLDEARVGDVVVFARDGRLFAHRVVSRSAGSLITQGDTIPTPDPSVSASELLGKVYSVLRHGKPVPAAMQRTVAGRMTALLLRRSTLVGRVLTRLYSLPPRTGL